MRRIAMVATLVVLLVFSGMAFAFQNEPEGFRGLKWGDPPGEEMEFMADVDELMKVYRSTSENNRLGDARFYLMLYTFYIPPGASVKRFTGAALYFRSKENFDILETVCKVKFGEPTEKGYLELGWMSLATTVVLGYDSIEETGYLTLGSTPIFNQYTKEKERQQAESAEEDW
ncbi:MAG: hypothetical protein GH145_02315 [Firmicutes bacterium]|nr:hypothetical protein [Bacillota bacterium]